MSGLARASDAWQDCCSINGLVGGSAYVGLAPRLTKDSPAMSFSSTLAAVSQRFKEARFASALSHLSDRELAQIGLKRSQIPARAAELSRL